MKLSDVANKFEVKRFYVHRLGDESGEFYSPEFGLDQADWMLATGEISNGRFEADYESCKRFGLRTLIVRLGDEKQDAAGCVEVRRMASAVNSPWTPMPGGLTIKDAAIEFYKRRGFTKLETIECRFAKQTNVVWYLNVEVTAVHNVRGLRPPEPNQSPSVEASQMGVAVTP